MGEIAADAGRVLVDVDGGGVRGRGAVPERDVAVDEVADRLDAAPAGLRRAEQLPRSVAQHVREAIPARQRVDQRLVGERFDRDLLGLGRIAVELVGDHDGRIVAKAQAAGAEVDPAADVAVEIDVIVEWDTGIRDPTFGEDALRVGRERAHEDDRRRGHLRLVVELAADLDPHDSHPSQPRGGAISPNGPRCRDGRALTLR